MRAILRRFFLLVFLISPCLAREVPIVVVHTTDLHGNVLPTNDLEGNRDVGGVARCATVIRKIRAEHPDAIVVDDGDLWQGTALGYLTGGAVMTRYLNDLGYDAWVLGNHEFDWGIAKLAARIAEAKMPVLAANLKYQSPAGAAPELAATFARVKPYVIRTVDGVKVAVVGLTTPGVPNWSRPRLIPGLTFEDSVTALRRVIPQVKAEGAQVLVLAAHQGMREKGDDHANQLYAVTRAFPELDLLIGGHSHRLFPEQMLNHILYTQANYWGTHVGQVDLVFDTDQKRVTRRKSVMLPMDASVPTDAELVKALQTDLDRTDALLKEKIGETALLLCAGDKPKDESPVFNLVCEAIAEAVTAKGGKVDAVIHGILREGIWIKPGPITMQDVFRIIPYENTIGVLTLNRDQLLEILEEDAGAWSGRQFRGAWGLTVKLKPSAPAGQRILFVGDREGRSLDPKARLRVAFNSFDLTGGGMRWQKLRALTERSDTELREYDFETRDAVADYIRKHSPLKIENRGWWQTERGR
jgi:2',3'-cyclic-nucleotide 2'-phosphodiesterase/3'-nucleotidase